MVADYGIKTYEDSSKEAYDEVFKIDEKDIKSVIDNDEDPSPYNASKKCYISAAGNKKHPSGRLVYWLAKYGDVYSTHTCNSYIHCKSAEMPSRKGSVDLLPLKKKK